MYIIYVHVVPIHIYSINRVKSCKRNDYLMEKTRVEKRTMTNHKRDGKKKEKTYENANRKRPPMSESRATRDAVMNRAIVSKKGE